MRNPTANGYAESPNFNELHAQRMAEMDAKGILPAKKRRQRAPESSDAITGHGYADAPNYNALVATRLAELRAQSPAPKPVRARRKPTAA